MKQLLKFVVDLVLPFVLIGVGGTLLTLSFDHESGMLFWSGLVLIVLGAIWALWSYLSNGGPL
ncbi:MAG: hypothetical protein AAF525_02190 [Pseudomonadota bacterium]